MAFPPTTSNHIAKTKRLVSLYAEIEKCMLNNPDDLFSTFKEKVKSIVGIKIEVEKNLLYYIDEYIKTKVKSSTQQVFLTTKARIENFDANASFDTIDRNWLERYQANELHRGRMQNGIAIDLRNIRRSGLSPSSSS